MKSRFTQYNDNVNVKKQIYFVETFLNSNFQIIFYNENNILNIAFMYQLFTLFI